MTLREKSSYKDVTKNILDKMPNMGKWQYYFISETFGLFLSIKGRPNFLGLARYGKRGEQHYRSRFAKDFDFLSFNAELAVQHGSEEFTIAFDPSYVNKSGKATPGVGHFWSGASGRAKWGLEMSGIAAIDVQGHTAFHLESVQAPGELGPKSLPDHHGDLSVDRKQQLLPLSKYIVADAYFSKHGFTSKLLANGFELVSRLRNDADLNYKYVGAQKKGRGRPKKHDGKVLFAQLREGHFECLEENEECKIYQGKVYSKSLKRDINLVVVKTLKKGKWGHRLYFSTDLDLSGRTPLDYYRKRFQIEFIFRDAKQHAGLEHCQARSAEKLHFHWNASPTAVNLAKAAHWLPLPKQERGAFSMSDVKTPYNNDLMLKRFSCVFAIDPNRPKNKEKIRKLLTYGARAA